jgi:hypothetical protein
MDNVKLSFEVPQEDELATNVLSVGNEIFPRCQLLLPLLLSQPVYAKTFPSNRGTGYAEGRFA